MMTKRAIFSLDKQYRYTLSREWNPKLLSVMFVMLNPSTADSFSDDATIRRCIGFADRWGYGGILVVNLYALRSPHPDFLWHSAYNPVGKQNDHYIKSMAGSAGIGKVVCAWGNEAHRDRADHVSRLILETRLETRVSLEAGLDNSLYCLGKTNSGAPRHPVRLPYSTQLEVYRRFKRKRQHANALRPYSQRVCMKG